MLRLPVLMNLALLALSSSVGAASFDCKTNRKPDEVAICNDSTLSSLDSELAAIYVRLRASFAPEQASALRETQLSWLRSRRACGNDRGCLVGLYRDRIDSLNAHASPQQHTNPNPQAIPAEVPPAPTLEGIAASSQDPDREETQLILEVIANAFKCPVPVTTWGGLRNDKLQYTEHFVHTFTGNATVLSFETRSTYVAESRRETLQRRSLPISELGKVKIVMNYSRDPTLPLIGIECRDRPGCMEEWVEVLCQVDVGPGIDASRSCRTTKRQPMRKLSDRDSGTDNIYICDKETASTLAEALTALRDKAGQQHK
ncbi:DUF1311 domain-containing protein [Bradyrhizobium sp. 197]|uniref:lysozyme inhibitor LprI family protein n=1 Tax=Bradyrhizobium sp. 197 TaxID=2782663 RepID=UPI001FFBFBF1|nr:lysozyme inhibitor LprI family protein [Bradyrhizobium sp. 197]MCK1480121.1 DUF1311 domain-containing protein [Bradyrhizobium sp. 197]